MTLKSIMERKWRWRKWKHESACWCRKNSFHCSFPSIRSTVRSLSSRLSNYSLSEVADVACTHISQPLSTLFLLRIILSSTFTIFTRALYRAAPNEIYFTLRLLFFSIHNKAIVKSDVISFIANHEEISVDSLRTFGSLYGNLSR